MANGVQNSISRDLISMKADLGSLLELFETWIVSRDHEKERMSILQDLAAVIRDHGAQLPAIERARVERGLNRLVAPTAGEDACSLLYVQRLQDKVSELTERLGRRMEEHLLHVNQMVGAAASPDGERNAGFILAQEDERKRISREIHDGPAQSLASLTMRIDFCLENIGDPSLLQHELAELKSSIIRSLKDIRRFIFDLRPMALDDLGLVPTLEQFINGFKQRTGIPVYLAVEGERVTLPVDRALGVFRVIQEAVNNASRHAEAKAVHVFLNFDAKRSRLCGVVKDDGKGFDLAEVRKNYATLKKLGLTSMEERIRLAGGDFEIVSHPGAGTVVSFTVPLALSIG